MGVRGMASRAPTVQSNGTDIDKQTTLWTSAGAWHSLYYKKQTNLYRLKFKPSFRFKITKSNEQDNLIKL